MNNEIYTTKIVKKRKLRLEIIIKKKKIVINKIALKLKYSG